MKFLLSFLTIFVFAAFALGPPAIASDVDPPDKDVGISMPTAEKQINAFVDFAPVSVTIQQDQMPALLCGHFLLVAPQQHIAFEFADVSKKSNQIFKKPFTCGTSGGLPFTFVPCLQG